MRPDFLPFSRPSIDESDIAAVAKVLRSGWITTGPKVAEFEQAFRARTGAEYAAAVASATAGMHLLLTALGIGPGDEVVTPAMTWVSTVNLIVLSGATPVFADVDRDTLMVTPETVKAALTERTKLIIPVHFGGAPVAMAPLRHLARDRGIHLVEDAAHALGTEYRAEEIGRRGTAVFSFHPVKNITCGEGGMVCSDDSVLMETLRRLRFHGLGVDAYDRSMQGRAAQAEVLTPGFKYNLTDMAAALGLGQLARLEDFVEKRSRLARIYGELLGGVEEVSPLDPPDPFARHSWHLFVVRIDIERAGMAREMFMAALRERNIGTGIHFKAVHTQKYYRERFALPPGALPATEWNSERLLSLPLFPDMTPEDVVTVVETIREVLA